MRVLLVEDDPDLSRQLKSALADAGYAVDHAPDGEEAHFLGDNAPDRRQPDEAAGQGPPWLDGRRGRRRLGHASLSPSSGISR